MFTGSDREKLAYIASELRAIARRSGAESLSDSAVMIEAVSAMFAPTPDKIDLTKSIDVSTMTTDEIRALKKELYEAASDVRAACYVIAQFLGEQLNARYGPKFEWLYGNIEPDAKHTKRADLIIYYDAYGGYLIVTYKGKQVLSTHKTSELFVPGHWVHIVNNRAVEAYSIKQRKEADRAEQIRARLAAHFDN